MLARLRRSLGILANNVGVTCKRAGRLGAADRSYRIAVATGPSDPRLVAALLHNLAGLAHARGRYAEAEPIARHGLALRQRLQGTEHPDFAADLGALAAIVDARGGHEEAEAMYRRALALPAMRPDDAAVARRNLALLLDRRSGRDHAPETGARSRPERGAARAT